MMSVAADTLMMTRLVNDYRSQCSVKESQPDMRDDSGAKDPAMSPAHSLVGTHLLLAEEAA